MAHSRSGSRAAAPSTADEAFTDAGAEDVGDSKLSVLLFSTITSPPPKKTQGSRPLARSSGLLGAIPIPAVPLLLSSSRCWIRLLLGSMRFWDPDWWLLMRIFVVHASFEECLLLGCGD